MVGEKCYLSPPQMQDAGKYAEWLNDLDVTIPLGDEAYTPVTLEGMQADIIAVGERHDHLFTIVDCATNAPIGRCLLFNVDLVNGCAMLGIFIGDKSFWNRGYGQEATELLLDYGFNLLNLHNIRLGVYAFNTRAIRAYEKVGFKLVGRLRETRLIGGKRHDEVEMDMLADEFRARHKSRIKVISNE